ncbi:MAG: sugar transferase [Oscillospiraceae bacterium]|jgi:O-antigen biosynthesis protein WbqP|nr:sugar transferase [Oscillospiraceae bacterium]
MRLWLFLKLKRTMDILLSVVMLIVFAPLFALVAVLIKMDSPGSILFAQNRVGRGGKLFRIYKFRSMYTHVPSSVATKNLLDSKLCITKIGRVLRKSSIDELPQLINVLKGEMSLIGPRPLVPEEREIHELRRELGAYTVRPGITGLSQVNGRDIVDAKSKAETDAWYASNISLWLDVKIVFYSVLCVVTARGVQEGGETPSDAPEEETDTRVRSERRRA